MDHRHRWAYDSSQSVTHSEGPSPRVPEQQKKSSHCRTERHEARPAGHGHGRGRGRGHGATRVLSVGIDERHRKFPAPSLRPCPRLDSSDYERVREVKAS